VVRQSEEEISDSKVLRHVVTETKWALT